MKLKLSLVLFLADLFHPVDGLAVKMLQDSSGTDATCAGFS